MIAAGSSASGQGSAVSTTFQNRMKAKSRSTQTSSATPASAPIQGNAFNEISLRNTASPVLETGANRTY